MVGDMKDMRYELDRLGVTAILYIRDGIPELEDGAPYWIYNDLRQWLHEANKCEDAKAVNDLLSKMKEHGYGVKKIKLLAIPNKTAKWIGNKIKEGWK